MSPLDEILAGIPLAAAIVRGRRAVAANDRLCRLTGHSREALLGADDVFRDFMAGTDVERLAARSEARQRGEQVPDDYEFTGRRQDGTIMHGRAHASLFPPAGDGALLWICTEERDRAELAATIRIFVDSAVAAQRQPSEAGVFEVVQKTLEAHGFRVTWIELEETRFRFLAGASGAVARAMGAVHPAWMDRANFPLTGVNNDQGLLIEDLPGVLAQGLNRPRADFQGLVGERAVVTSIPVEGVERYALACSGRGLDNTVASAFGLFGKQLGAALETARGLSRMTRANRELLAVNEELSLLLELGQEVLGASDVRSVLSAAARISAKLLHCTRAWVLLPDAAGKVLEVAASAGPPLPGGVPLVPLPLDGSSLSARAFELRVPQTTVDAPNDPRIPPGLAERYASRSSLAVPLVARDRALGVLSLVEPGARAFGPQDLRVAMLAAQLVATAVDSARLNQDLRKSYGELARAQRELISRERLAALGELSASIAHEVRNPLGVIFNSVGSLRRILKPDGDVALLLGIVGEEADRLNRMVGDLLDYSRPLQPALQPMGLRAMLEEALESSRQQAGPGSEGVEARLRVGRDVSTVRADARLLRQALVNLFLNAMQAMPQGGRLSVEARRTELLGAASVQLLISDTGPGIASELRERIWQPFFTTKATGTGLGLAVVKRIVEGHGGRVELADGSGGARFQLVLPLGI